MAKLVVLYKGCRKVYDIPEDMASVMRVTHRLDEQGMRVFCDPGFDPEPVVAWRLEPEPESPQPPPTLADIYHRFYEDMETMFLNLDDGNDNTEIATKTIALFEAAEEQVKLALLRKEG